MYCQTFSAGSQAAGCRRTQETIQQRSDHRQSAKSTDRWQFSTDKWHLQANKRHLSADKRNLPANKRHLSADKRNLPHGEGCSPHAKEAAGLAAAQHSKLTQQNAWHEQRAVSAMNMGIINSATIYFQFVLC